jgi:peptidoglycan/LPS O-acetylase OafA/YrhL
MAAGMVVLYHIRINVLVGPDEVMTHGAARWLTWVLYRIGDCGPQAVLWFFVISGFLIGGKVVEDVQRGRFDLFHYAVARISRLYVVLVPAIATGYAMDLTRVTLFGLNGGAGSETAMSYGLPTIFANLLCLQTILAPTLGSNLPLWSLACEAWYYALFPFLVLAVAPQRVGRQRIVSLMAVAAIGVLLLHNPKIVAYFVFWLLGVALWFCPVPIMRSRLLAWLIAGASMAAYPMVTGHVRPLMMLLVAFSFANVLLTVMHTAADEGRARWFSHWHGYLAGFSYSLYLTHAPLLHLCLTIARAQPDPRLSLQPQGWLPIGCVAGLLVLLYGYGWLFSRLTEARMPQVRDALRRLVGTAHALFS